jgi:hypothetical protein
MHRGHHDSQRSYAVQRMLSAPIPNGVTLCPWRASRPGSCGMANEIILMRTTRVEFVGRQIPLGLLVRQMQAGGTITVGNMTWTARPDAYFAGLRKVNGLIDQGLLTGPAVPYVTKTLTIMVPKGKPGAHQGSVGPEQAERPAGDAEPRLRGHRAADQDGAGQGLRQWPRSDTGFPPPFPDLSDTPSRTLDDVILVQDAGRHDPRIRHHIPGQLAAREVGNQERNVSEFTLRPVPAVHQRQLRQETLSPGPLSFSSSPSEFDPRPWRGTPQT